MLTTNGFTNQWNFYVFTNTRRPRRSFTNVAFVTFLPPDLGLPRADIEWSGSAGHQLDAGGGSGH